MTTQERSDLLLELVTLELGKAALNHLLDENAPTSDERRQLLNMMDRMQARHKELWRILTEVQS